MRVAEFRRGDVATDGDAEGEFDPAFREEVDAPGNDGFFEFEGGDAVDEEAVGQEPSWASSSAQARPAGSEPMMAARRPLGMVGVASTTPWVKAYSLMKRLTEPMATGSLLQLRMRARSQSRSCGHTREPISGLLLVERERAAASRNGPWLARASYSGIRFERGQAWAHRA